MLDFDAEYSKLIQAVWELNKTISNPVARRKIAECLSARLPAFAEGTGTGAAAAANLASEGFHPLGEALSAAEIAEIQAYLAGCRVYDSGALSFQVARVERSEFALADRPAQLLFASYKIEDAIRCKPLVRLACRADIVDAVRSQLGCTPTLAAFSVTHAFPGTGAPVADRFHRDRDCFRSVRLLAYLSAAGDDAGPHQYIRSSHNPELLQSYFAARGARVQMPALFEKNSRNIDPAQLQQLLGERIVSFTGPPGLALLEDSYGLNRDTPPASAPRLTFSATYSALPLRFANENDRAYEMGRRASFADAGLGAATDLQRYLFRYFLH